MRTICFALGEHTYRGTALNAFDQFECLNVLALISERVRGVKTRGALDQVGLITSAVEALDEGTADRLCALCLPGLTRRDAGGDWCPVWDAEAADLLLDDIGAARLLSLIARVVAENLQSYLAREPFDLKSDASRSLSFSVVELPGGKSWLMRPVEAGMCKFESLLDGTLVNTGIKTGQAPV